MKIYDQFLDEYSSKFYSVFTRNVPEEEWGNKAVALAYLQRYYSPEEDYLKNWQPIQHKIFTNQDKGLPAMMFREGFSLLALRGGAMFEKADFESLQRCMHQLGDQRLYIVQNDFGEQLTRPKYVMNYPTGITLGGQVIMPKFIMNYPADITWEELMGGNFISTALFEMLHHQYFVFSESGKWGVYVDNDYEHPLQLIGFHPDHEMLFRKNFAQPPEEWAEIKDWLPPLYKGVVKPTDTFWEPSKKSSPRL